MHNNAFIFTKCLLECNIGNKSNISQSRNLDIDIDIMNNTQAVSKKKYLIYTKLYQYGGLKFVITQKRIQFIPLLFCVQDVTWMFLTTLKKKVREKSRECHNHKP